MSRNADAEEENSSGSKKFLTGLARAFGGAVLFSVPILMTMEMWELGFYMNRFRLALFIFLAIPLLVGLSYFDGYEQTNDLKDDVVDAFVAYAVGFVASTAILFVLNLINWEMSANEIIGKISVQAVMCAFGALYAQSQLGGDSKYQKQMENKSAGKRYFGEIVLMIIGALLISMNIAPTEEIILLSYKMTDWHIAGLAVAVILTMHAFVYVVAFRGQEKMPENTSILSVFLRYTIVGYAVVLLIGLYLLWTFGRIDGNGTLETLRAVIVLSFPGALGASAARLIL